MIRRTLRTNAPVRIAGQDMDRYATFVGELDGVAGQVEQYLTQAVGVAWPLEAIPPILRTASFVLPSTFGIDALVRVNQMGASLTDVWKDWMRLWVLAGVYAIIVIASVRIAARWRASDVR